MWETDDAGNLTNLNQNKIVMRVYSEKISYEKTLNNLFITYLLMENKKAEFNKIKMKVLRVLKKYGIKKASIFGSYARGEQKRGSDIDILIQPKKNMGFEFFGLGEELEEKLGKKVDLVTYKSIQPYLKEYILRDEVRIL